MKEKINKTSNQMIQTQKKNLINQSNQKADDYAELSNSNNHSQLEAAEEFEIEEDMIECQHQTEDVQYFNTQNFYNRQHYVGNRVVPQDKNFKEFNKKDR